VLTDIKCWVVQQVMVRRGAITAPPMILKGGALGISCLCIAKRFFGKLIQTDVLI
jgi:hypothetical protein